MRAGCSERTGAGPAQFKFRLAVGRRRPTEATDRGGNQQLGSFTHGRARYQPSAAQPTVAPAALKRGLPLGPPLAFGRRSAGRVEKRSRIWQPISSGYTHYIMNLSGASNWSLDGTCKLAGQLSKTTSARAFVCYLASERASERERAKEQKCGKQRQTRRQRSDWLSGAANNRITTSLLN